MSQQATNTTKSQRIAVLDFIRGIAILMMLLFHFCFGLSQINLLDIQMSTSPYWLGFRVVIVFLFLTLVGIGIILAKQKTNFYSSFIKRLLLLLIYAGLISLFSYSIRPFSYVFFGILHLILVASLVSLLFTKFYWANVIVAVLCFMTLMIQFAWLDHTAYLWWLGLARHHPATDDFAPIFPWIGFVFLGLFLGRFLFEKNRFPHLLEWQAKARFTKLLCWAGRYSIHLYFIHFQFFYVLVWLFNGRL